LHDVKEHDTISKYISVRNTNEQLRSRPRFSRRPSSILGASYAM